MTTTNTTPVPIDVDATVAAIVEQVQAEAAAKPSKPQFDYGDLDVTVSQAELLAALDFTKRDQTTRPPMQILLGVLLQATDEGLRVSRFDYEQANIETITGVGTGRAMVGAATLRDLVAGLDAGPLTLSVVGPRLHLVQADLSYTLVPFNLTDLPALPEPGTDIAAVMTGPELYQVLRGLVAAGRDDTLPVLTGALFNTTSGTLTVACTDRYRLTVWDSGIAASTLPLALVPAKPLSNIAVALKAEPEVEVRVSLERPDSVKGKPRADLQVTLVTFVAGGRTIILRTLEGEFPRYESLLPADFTSTLRTDGKPLAKAVQQVAKVATRNSPVRFELDADVQVLTAKGEDDQAARKVLREVEFAGMPLGIGANPAFLLDGIKACGSKDLVLSFTGPTRPFVLSNPLDGTFRYLLMPVRQAG